MTAAELNALPYRPPASSLGITAGDTLTHLGEMRTQVRVWRSFKVDDKDIEGPEGAVAERDGHIYIELKPDETILVWRHETKKEEFREEIGWIRKGETAISNIPDEIELAYLDRVLFVGGTTFIGTVGFEASGEERDKLPYRHTSDLMEVIADGEILESGFGLVVEADGSSFIEWETIPDSALITFRYYPEYTYQQLDRTPPVGGDGKRLPQRGILRLQQRGEHDEE